MLDEYADEFGTNLESKIPGFNDLPIDEETVPVQDQPSAQPQRKNPRPSFFQSRPQAKPAPVQENLYAQNNQAQNYQYQYQSPTPPPPPQPPIYQQYVYQQQPAMQQPMAQPMPSYQPPVQQPLPSDQPRSRINNIFSEESKELNELLRAEENAGCLRNIVFIATCLLVVVVSFWASYSLGSKFFLPINQKDLMSKGTVNKAISKFKKVFTAGGDVIKTEKEFVNYRIPDSPQTPVLPPEIMNIPDRPAPPTPKQRQTAKPKSLSSAAITGATMYRVVAGSYDTKQQAQDALVNIKADGFPGFVFASDGKFKLQIGAFKNKAAATALVKKASEYGYNATVATK